MNLPPSPESFHGLASLNQHATEPASVRHRHCHPERRSPRDGWNRLKGVPGSTDQIIAELDRVRASCRGIELQHQTRSRSLDGDEWRRWSPAHPHHHFIPGGQKAVLDLEADDVLSGSVKRHGGPGSGRIGKGHRSGSADPTPLEPRNPGWQRQPVVAEQSIQQEGSRGGQLAIDSQVDSGRLIDRQHRGLQQQVAEMFWQELLVRSLQLITSKFSTIPIA